MKGKSASPFYKALAKKFNIFHIVPQAFKIHQIGQDYCCPTWSVGFCWRWTNLQYSQFHVEWVDVEKGLTHISICASNIIVRGFLWCKIFHMNKSLLNTMQMCWWQHDDFGDWQNANMGREANFSTIIFMGIIVDI